MAPYESIHKYIEKFWELHLKDFLYKRINFEEKKQQLYIGITEEMSEYANSQDLKPFLQSSTIQWLPQRCTAKKGAKETQSLR